MISAFSPSIHIKISDRLLMSWCWNYWIVCYHLSIHSFLTSPSVLGIEPPRSMQAGTVSPFTPLAFGGLWESPSLIKDFNKHIASFLTLLLNCSLLLERCCLSAVCRFRYLVCVSLALQNICVFTIIQLVCYACMYLQTQ